jgi:hypothetical protein
MGIVDEIQVAVEHVWAAHWYPRVLPWFKCFTQHDGISWLRRQQRMVVTGASQGQRDRVKPSQARHTAP